MLTQHPNLRLLLFIIITLAAIVLLAAGLADFELQPGQPFPFAVLGNNSANDAPDGSSSGLPSLLLTWWGLLTILAFILPTLLGILVFSIYPFIFNGFISLTDRGKFHPNPDCSQKLWSIVEPTCWLSKEQRGLATPFSIRDPWYQNYSDLIGGLSCALHGRP